MGIAADIIIIVIASLAGGLVAKLFRQPLILGYILAGFLVGPHISWFPGIASEETVRQWSDIGIIFLMFGLGL